MKVFVYVHTDMDVWLLFCFYPHTESSPCYRDNRPSYHPLLIPGPAPSPP